ncbi:MAG: hypothetical protein ABT940_09445 [Alphaproteobacteria bacterium]
MATEIYSCKDGQGLREGKLDYSSEVNTKEEAEVDAQRRCQKDPTIKRVAYYAVSEDGRFKNFFTYNNANARPAGKSPPRPGGQPARRPGKIPPAPRPKTLWERILAVLGLGKS